MEGNMPSNQSINVRIVSKPLENRWYVIKSKKWISMNLLKPTIVSTSHTKCIFDWHPYYKRENIPQTLFEVKSTGYSK